jgi:cephalosporin-C deacetylase
VLRTLSYFDINNLVSLLRVPTDFFLGLSDPICLPPFVYSPYAHTKAEKRIVLSPLTGHDISYDYKMELYRAFAAL